jgi:hypothetical protein
MPAGQRVDRGAAHPEGGREALEVLHQGTLIMIVTALGVCPPEEMPLAHLKAGAQDPRYRSPRRLLRLPSASRQTSHDRPDPS